MNNGPKDFYDLGAELLKKYPMLVECHEKLRKFIIQSIPEEKLTKFCQNRKHKSEATMKQIIAILFSISAFFVVSGICQFLFRFSLFDLIFNALWAFIPYLFGVMYTEALKRKGGIWEEKTISVMPVTAKPKQEEPVPQKAPEKEIKKKITPFWRLFGLMETGCILGWVYFSLAEPKALKQWITQSGLMDYIPHELGVTDKWDETSLLIAGIVLLSIGFAVLRSVLKVVFWVSKRLVPKREIREI